MIIDVYEKDKYQKEIPVISGGNKYWYVFKDFEMSDFIIPKGFKTNLASVPRMLWFIFPTFGTWTTPSIIHDYLYATSNELKYTRKKADIKFRDLCIKYGTPKWKAQLFYYVVRTFGYFNYKKRKNSKIKIAKKLLKQNGCKDYELFPIAEWRDGKFSSHNDTIYALINKKMVHINLESKKVDKT